MIPKETLEQLYLRDGHSMKKIATELGFSVNKIAYWMDKHNIKRRTISDAIYKIHNPEGDPFTIKNFSNMAEAQLYGLGIGLFWGEGNKADKYSVRIGNTDPEIIKTFMQFLSVFFEVPKERLRFSLQIFTDIDSTAALRFWTRHLSVDSSQFYKITVTISGSLGTYRKKSQYGVVTLYYHNKKLRDIIVGLLPL